MTDEERARELVARWEHGDEAHRAWLRSVVVPDLVALMAEVRREAFNAERDNPRMNPWRLAKAWARLTRRWFTSSAWRT